MDSTITHFLDGWDKHDMVCSMGGKTESTHGLGLDGVQTFVSQLNRRATLIYHGGWLSYPALVKRQRQRRGWSDSDTRPGLLL